MTEDNATGCARKDFSSFFFFLNHSKENEMMLALPGVPRRPLNFIIEMKSVLIYFLTSIARLFI